MIKYILKRLLQSLLTLFIIATVVFFLMRLMPEEGYFGEKYDKMEPAQIEAELRAMGLRDPIPVQLFRYYGQLLHLNFGKSITVQPKKAIADIIAKKAPYSIRFGLMSVGISLCVGIPMGTVMALFKKRLPDKLGNMYIIFIHAVPAAVYYLFIQLYASGLFNVPILYNARDPSSMWLPVISMSLGGTASYAMWTRRYVVDQMNKDYVKFARAKGVSERRITFGHMLRNALVPMAQNLPASILLTISGSIYIESLYSIPGMGNLLLSAITRQDNPLVQALVLIYSSLGIFGLLLGDLLMVICDPRIKLVREKENR
ncbi:MAG: ABC transporter permease [Clostridia bacterium]|nr:ABC transporter permease [Clostridia bacterium]